MSQDCCGPNKSKTSSGWLSGLLYGLLPHSFCIAFIVFSAIGATVAASFFRQFLLIPHFFEFLIGLSFVFATVSAVFYLKKLKLLSVVGVKKKWRYLSVLYGTTLAINLFLFNFVFPIVAQINSDKISSSVVSENSAADLVTLMVDIPCSGHASLIIGDLKATQGVKAVEFNQPNFFKISYDSTVVSSSQILGIDVFKTYKAVII